MSIPRVHYSHVIGLLEVLDDFNGRVDIAKIADDLSLELDDLLPAVDAAELIGFVRVESGDIQLTDKGSIFLSEGTRGRKKQLGERLLILESFKEVIEFISQKEEKAVTKEDLLNFIGERFYESDSEEILKWVIEWGRHGHLLKYDSKEDEIRLV
ncbi:MAG: AAA-associated domain-containing protein [Candidatus Methylarchaceae archaeon HK02M1]|nr:AAA-associated domain-containing protein [Candidatus Methylarchaceae archaeon HK01M]MCP8311511.1 AAA-associated domain-containing protein [Candidatus Methylarchaceae archaeon HK02M1]